MWELDAREIYPGVFALNANGRLARPILLPRLALFVGHSGAACRKPMDSPSSLQPAVRQRLFDRAPVSYERHNGVDSSK